MASRYVLIQALEAARDGHGHAAAGFILHDTGACIGLTIAESARVHDSRRELLLSQTETDFIDAPGATRRRAPELRV